MFLQSGIPFLQADTEFYTFLMKYTLCDSEFIQPDAEVLCRVMLKFIQVDNLVYTVWNLCKIYNEVYKVWYWSLCRMTQKLIKADTEGYTGW